MKTNALATRQEADDLAVTTLTTDELVVVIEQEHELVEGAASAAISHAIRCGLALLEVRKRVPISQWAAWTDENLRIAPTHANRYIRIAYYREHILSSRLTSITAASTYLRSLSLPPTRGTAGNIRYPDELKKEAKRLHTEGLTYTAIGTLLGVHRYTIRDWVNPEVRKLSRQRQRNRTAKAKAARTALRQKERAEHIKRAGGKIDKAYGHLRWCFQEIDGALTEASDPDRRAVLRAVITHLQRAEEEMGKV